MNFSNPQVVFQEVPGEISLALSISGCNLHCKECHSSETWDPKYGEPLTKSKLSELLRKYKYISTVLFYGGEWNLDKLTELIKFIKSKNIKVCLYTGQELDYFSKDFLSLLDYIKVGPYIASKGGIGTKGTNQKFIKLRK